MVHQVAAFERVYRQRSPAATDEVRRVLAEGEIVGDNPLLLGQGMNGPRRAYPFAAPAPDGLWGVPKRIAHSGAHEVFGYEVARAMGIDGALATVARRPDGSAMIEYVQGVPLVSAGAGSPQGLESVLASAIRLQRPDATADQAAADARLSRELIQSFDVILGNGDRHGQNGIVDAQRGVVALIDHGMLKAGDTPTVRAAYTLPGFNRPGFVAELPLSADTLAILDAVDTAHIQRAGAQLVADAAGTNAGQTIPASEKLVAQVLRRLDQTLATGMLRFKPVPW